MMSRASRFTHKGKQMTIAELIQLAERRIAYLEQRKVAAQDTGDVDMIARCDRDITETQTTLNALRGL